MGKRSVFAYLDDGDVEWLELVSPAERHPAGRVSLTDFFRQVQAVVECARVHSGDVAIWAWLREAVALRARVPGRLRAGRTADARPLTLSDRARLFPAETRGLIARAHRLHRGQPSSIERELGAAPGDLAVALRQLPGLAEELRAAGGAL